MQRADDCAEPQSTLLSDSNGSMRFARASSRPTATGRIYRAPEPLPSRQAITARMPLPLLDPSYSTVA
jgi:hypothetical protein